ncbi:MAG: XTP/dITP diphosphatase [Tissierellia bacterium]|nr:XTP/dITP diphosphatase [Tissierellia bacterium]
MNKSKLVLATGNPNKIEEIRDILKELPIEVLSKEDVGLKNIDIEEDGNTLEENAIKKARAIANEVEGMVMADDSGLFVDFLGGAPGVHSARYSGENSTDEENNRKLLEELKGVPMEKRGASFKAVMALVTEEGKIITVSGECRGTIAFEARGKEGFGYDPLFIVDGYDKTFAELGEEVKNKISHRAKALDQLKKEITKLLEDDGDADICSK